MTSESARLRCITSYTRLRPPITPTKGARIEPLLLKTEANRLDWVGRVDEKMLLLVGIDQGREHVEAVLFPAPQVLDLAQRPLVIRFGPSRLNLRTARRADGYPSCFVKVPRSK